MSGAAELSGVGFGTMELESAEVKQERQTLTVRLGRYKDAPSLRNAMALNSLASTLPGKASPRCGNFSMTSSTR